MGLEIYYDLHAPATWHADRVRETIESARRFALTLDFAEVDVVKPNDPEQPQHIIVRRVPDDFPRPCLSALAEAGWYFRTWPGERCETAFFGLCHFPSRVECEGRSVPLGWGSGWHYHSSCKTQYADLASRDYFLKCHLGVIAILDFFRDCGCRVRVRDGGGYWKSRSERLLFKRLEDMHAMVAAVTGAFKDATEGMEGQTIAPISERNDFERLEARGREMFRRNRRKRVRKQSMS